MVRIDWLKAAITLLRDLKAVCELLPAWTFFSSRYPDDTVDRPWLCCSGSLQTELINHASFWNIPRSQSPKQATSDADLHLEDFPKVRQQNEGRHGVGSW